MLLTYVTIAALAVWSQTGDWCLNTLALVLVRLC